MAFLTGQFLSYIPLHISPTCTSFVHIIIADSPASSSKYIIVILAESFEPDCIGRWRCNTGSQPDHVLTRHRLFDHPSSNPHIPLALESHHQRCSWEADCMGWDIVALFTKEFKSTVEQFSFKYLSKQALQTILQIKAGLNTHCTGCLIFELFIGYLGYY